MRSFLTINFIIFLVLISCDAGIMSSNVEDDSNSKEDLKPLKPINIVGTYECDNKKYLVRVTKDNREFSGYLLELADNFDHNSLTKVDTYEYDNDKKLFKFTIDNRNSIDYILLFEEQGHPTLTILNEDKTFKLQPYISNHYKI